MPKNSKPHEPGKQPRDDRGRFVRGDATTGRYSYKRDQRPAAKDEKRDDDWDPRRPERRKK